MRYKLQVVNPQDGTIERQWILQLPTDVGRDPEAGVAIGDPSISRRHCQFYLNGAEALCVRDLDSMNGTHIGARQVKKAVLKPDDLIRIGNIHLKLEWTDEPLTSKRPFGRADKTTTQPMDSINIYEIG